MKALKITIIALLAGFSMASCDFLDKEPTKLTPENYFNTPAERHLRHTVATYFLRR